MSFITVRISEDFKKVRLYQRVRSFPQHAYMVSGAETTVEKDVEDVYICPEPLNACHFVSYFMISLKTIAIM